MNEQIRVFRQPHRCRGLAVYIDAFNDALHTGYTAEPIRYKEIQSIHGEDATPHIILKENQAQQLMDDLWQCGLRPTEGTGSAGAMAATQGHLKDLRKILFKRLGLTE